MLHKVKIRAATQDSHKTSKLSVERIEGYDFTPGQATEVVLDQQGDRDNSSLFTFTSLSGYPYIGFSIKTYPERHGELEKMWSLQGGDYLLTSHPWGAIDYQGSGMFIADGAGITPFRSIFRDLHNQGELQKNISFTRITTGATSLPPLNSRQAPVIMPVSTQTEEGEGEGFQQGRIDSSVLRGFLGRIKPDYCYVCGTTDVAEDAISALKELEIDDSKIVCENS